jgi:putative sterol carrier protein
MTMGVAIGTLEFHEMLAQMLNSDPHWAELGADLTYNLIFGYDEPINQRFLLRFDKGRMTEVRYAQPGDAAHATLKGPPDTWRKIFSGETSPLMALARRKLEVSGQLSLVMKNVGAFNYVVDSMAKLDIDPARP